jgi:hypothetical protein
MAATGFLTTLPEGGLSANHSSAKVTLGSIITDNQGNIYRYVRIDSSSVCATTEGSTCKMQAASASTWVVTPDQSRGIGTTTGKVVGVAQSAIDTGNYGFMLVSGIGEVRTAGNIAAGNYLESSATDHEATTVVNAVEEQVFAMALEADSATEPHKALSYIFCL